MHVVYFNKLFSHSLLTSVDLFNVPLNDGVPFPLRLMQFSSKRRLQREC